MTDFDKVAIGLLIQQSYLFCRDRVFLYRDRISLIPKQFMSRHNFLLS